MTAKQALELIETTPTTLEGTLTLSADAQHTEPGAARSLLAQFASASWRAKIYAQNGDLTLADSWTEIAGSCFDSLVRLSSQGK